MVRALALAGVLAMAMALAMAMVMALAMALAMAMAVAMALAMAMVMALSMALAGARAMALAMDDHMKTERKNPGYRVTIETHNLVRDYAKKLSEELGFTVSNNKALEVLIKKGWEAVKNEKD